MDLDNFIVALSEQFDDTDISLITPDCVFQDLEEWSSLTSMSIIAMVKTEYGKTITGKEIRECKTFKDLYDLVSSK